MEQVGKEFSREDKVRIVAEAKEHGLKETAAKYGIRNPLIVRAWMANSSRKAKGEHGKKMSEHAELFYLRGWRDCTMQLFVLRREGER